MIRAPSAALLLFACSVLPAVANAAVVPHDARLAPKQILYRGNGLEPETIDPARARSDSAARIIRDLYEGLTTEAPDGKVVAGVADRWQISADGRSYEFHIRATARWSNGAPVTAQDFVAGMQRTVDPATASQYATVLSPIVNADAIIAGKLPPSKLGVEALDAHRLRITLAAPTPYFLGLLAQHSTFPIYRPGLKKYGHTFTQPGHLVSDGAYKLSEWVVNGHITLTRNKYYWNDAHTVVDQVVYLPIDDENSELARYRAGQLDITYTVPINKYPWLKANLADQLHVAPYLSTYYYGFNLTRPPFKDAPKLRQALSMAIDRKILADKVIATGVKPAYGWVPPGVNDYTPQHFAWADWPRARQIEEAKKLYREAGYSSARPLTTELRYNSGEQHQRIAGAIAAMWKSVLGVQTHLVNEEWKAFLEDRNAMQVTQVFRSAWGGDYNDAYTFAGVFLSDNSISDTGYASTAYDRLVGAAAAEADVVKRRRLLQQAEQTLLADNPLIPLYFYVSKHMVKPYVGGWRDNVMDHHYTRDLYILRH